MWIGYWLFKIGKYIGYIIKAWGVISPMLGIFTSKKAILWGIILLLIFGSIGFGYWQRTKYINAKETIETQKTTISKQEKIISNIKQDAEEKNNIISDLKEENKQYLDKLDKLDSNIDILISKITNGSQSEKENAKKEVSKSIINSYNCIMKASGVDDAECKE
jgi:CHASE3 domain sensor protein